MTNKLMTMKKYKSPTIRIVNVNAATSIMAGSNGTLTGGGSNAGQNNPTAESKGSMWFDDEETEF